MIQREKGDWLGLLVVVQIDRNRPYVVWLNYRSLLYSRMGERDVKDVWVMILPTHWRRDVYYLLIDRYDDAHNDFME